jgi:hypothetical protein
MANIDISAVTKSLKPLTFNKGFFQGMTSDPTKIDFLSKVALPVIGSIGGSIGAAGQRAQQQQLFQQQQQQSAQQAAMERAAAEAAQQRTLLGQYGMGNQDLRTMMQYAYANKAFQQRPTSTFTLPNENIAKAMAGYQSPIATQFNPEWVEASKQFSSPEAAQRAVAEYNQRLGALTGYGAGAGLTTGPIGANRQQLEQQALSQAIQPATSKKGGGFGGFLKSMIPAAASFIPGVGPVASAGLGFMLNR